MLIGINAIQGLGVYVCSPLKCEHHGMHATFLDLDIKISDGVFVYKLYDKRDDFPFFVVRMPDRSSNIPSYIFYGTIGTDRKRTG